MERHRLPTIRKIEWLACTLCPDLSGIGDSLDEDIVAGWLGRAALALRTANAPADTICGHEALRYAREAVTVFPRRLPDVPDEAWPGQPPQSEFARSGASADCIAQRGLRALLAVAAGEIWSQQVYHGDGLPRPAWIR